VTPELDVRGRRLTIRHLDRVIFPATGTTKKDLLDYYIRIADAMLPHLRDRLLHMHRYPEGVTGPRFWQKACPDHHPDWIPTARPTVLAFGTEDVLARVAKRGELFGDVLTLRQASSVQLTPQLG
jgi:DNA primase